MKNKSEADFANKVDADLATLKHGYFENIDQKVIRHTPDRLGVINRRFVAIEIKKDGKKAKPGQARKLNKIRQAGGKAYTATPLSWKSIFRELKELDQSII